MAADEQAAGSMTARQRKGVRSRMSEGGDEAHALGRLMVMSDMLPLHTVGGGRRGGGGGGVEPGRLANQPRNIPAHLKQSYVRPSLSAGLHMACGLGLDFLQAFVSMR